jgi:hypothetical protein
VFALKGGRIMKAAMFIMVGVLFVFSTVDLFSASIKEEYELSERCGKKCAEEFKSAYGNGISNDKDSSMMSVYTNHYNKKLNKCFLLLTTTSYSKDKKTGALSMKLIVDINENKEYGSFNKFLKDSVPLSCYVLEKNCSSEREWDSLVKPFMEE